MNRSIKSKLFISITALLAFFVIILCLLNSFYLQQYYVEKKKNILIKNAKELTNIYNGNPQEIIDELDRRAKITGSTIDIRDSNGKILFTSSRRLPNENNITENSNKSNNVPSPIEFNPNNEKFKKRIEETYKEGVYTFENRRDVQLKIDLLTLVTKLSNGDILSIKVPLISIKESVNIANKFIIITGIVIIILGSIWAYWFSKKFTKPILEVNDIANNMAKFDFTQKCNVNGKDEIGQLSESINYLSCELNRAITELNIKNKKLEEDIEKERKIDEMRKEFISSVSHELRTPLSVIHGYAEGLVSNVAENEEDRKFYCDVIIKETNKMNKLVRDLLNLSQIESGYFNIEKSEFNLTSLIIYILDKYKAVFLEKNIKIEFEVIEELYVCADMVRVEQIITNYLNNAINHLDDNKIIKLSTKIIDDKIKIYVFNSGKHILEESLDKIWKSFYKVDKARTRAYGGYGLGLSIVKAIVELHGTECGVDNTEGGVVFWFELVRMKV
ncbi:HAMP domain-containing sensor histidine kinase [Clostridium sp. C2-6-12]|uniref:sensor histidine kinase n=1 Tax=Clostridium sp. C2-6-12 TaxID=2698832 RepID=UPI001370E74F|nr:HAMP domain-containing sensor histidine kinase [Clostridium sp. C2-6-12]